MVYMDALLVPPAPTPPRGRKSDQSSYVQIDTEIMREINDVVREGQSSTTNPDITSWDQLRIGQLEEMQNGIQQLTQQVHAVNTTGVSHLRRGVACA